MISDCEISSPVKTNKHLFAIQSALASHDTLLDKYFSSEA